MATPGGFLDQNRERAYPFVTSTVTPVQPASRVGGQLILTSGQAVNPPFRPFYLPDAAVADFGALFGPFAKFNAGSDLVWLDSVSRPDATHFVFRFRCSAAGLGNYQLVFTHATTSDPFWTSTADASQIDVTITPVNVCANPFYMDGFLTTGDFGLLSQLMVVGETWQGGDTECVVEPALLQDLSAAGVDSISIANTPPTGWTPTHACGGPIPPVPSPVPCPQMLCLIGDVKIGLAHNTSARILGSTIIINASPGDGLGPPCQPILACLGEVRNTGPDCTQVFRAVNGIGGPILNVLVGRGVSLLEQPDLNQITFTVTPLGGPGTGCQ